MKNKNFVKSQRQLQLGEQIKRILAEIFLQDNLLELKNGHITILQADISPDAKNAKIFINIFGNYNSKEILNNLKQITPYLRTKLAARINLRYIPELMFVIDETAKQAGKIEDLLDEEGKKFS